METNHTPGPWYSVNYAGFIDLQKSNFYDGHSLLNQDKCERAEANGKLAAAAPELLEALKNLIFTAEKLWQETPIVKQFEGLAYCTHPMIEEAKQAVLKATE